MSEAMVLDPLVIEDTQYGERRMEGPDGYCLCSCACMDRVTKVDTGNATSAAAWVYAPPQ